MSKPQEPRAAELIREGLEEAVAFARGARAGVRVDRVPLTARHVAVREAPAFGKSRIIDIRSRMGLSQTVFAQALNVSPETVRAWEQGKNEPGGPALRLLEIAEEQPEVVLGRIRVKGVDDAGRYRPLLPRTTVLRQPFFSDAGTGARKASAAKRNPAIGLRGTVKGRAASLKAVHGSTKTTHGAPKAPKPAKKK